MGLHNGEILKKLFPVRFEGVLFADLNIEGSMFDELEDEIGMMRRMIVLDPALAVDGESNLIDALSGWEAVFNISPVLGATTLDRRSAVIGKFRAAGGLSKSFFENIASGLGYTIADSGANHLHIVEGEFAPFLCDFSALDDDMMCDQTSGSSVFTWRVLGTSVESDALLKTIFIDLCPPWSEVIFVNE
jgi:hypothetical protein